MIRSHIRHIVFVTTFIILGCEPETIIKKVPKERECIAENAPLYYPGEMIDGRVSGLKNCRPFLAEAIAYIKDDSVLLELHTYDRPQSPGNLREKLVIGSITDMTTWSSLKDSILPIQI